MGLSRLRKFKEENGPHVREFRSGKSLLLVCILENMGVDKVGTDGSLKEPESKTRPKKGEFPGIDGFGPTRTKG